MPRTPLFAVLFLTLTIVGSAGARAPAARQPGAKPPAAAAEGLPSAADVQQLFDEGKYKEALQKLSRVLALRGDAAKAYDRHLLLRLKGECHLRQKESAAAATAFELAAKEAPDETQRAVDVATAQLVKRSKNLTFTPSPKKAAPGAGGGAGAVKANANANAEKSGPIDITDPEKRKAAFAVMLVEQKDEVAPKLKAAKDAKSLPPVVAALEAAGTLRTLEVAATGDDAEVTGMVSELSGKALKMMADAVDDMAKTVEDIQLSANDLKEVRTPVRSPAPGGGVMLERSYKKKGLTTPDLQDLRRIIGDLQKLVPAAKELSEALGESGEEFKRVGKDAAVLHDKAREVLTYDYANDYTRSPRRNRDRRS